MLFSCLFQCFEEKEYQTESKRNETFGRVIFGTEAIQETWSRRQGSFEVVPRQGGTPAPWARPHPRGPLVAPLTDFFRLYTYISQFPLKTWESTIDREFCRRKPLQPPKTNRDPVPAPGRRGDPSPVAIFIISALSMTRRAQFTLGGEGMYQQLCV